MTEQPRGPMRLRVVPVPRINGIIVIANSQAKVRRAMVWIKRLDQQSITDPNYYVYAVQNGNAVELAKILKSTFGEGTGRRRHRRSGAGPRHGGGFHGCQPGCGGSGQRAAAGSRHRKDGPHGSGTANDRLDIKRRGNRGLR